MTLSTLSRYYAPAGARNDARLEISRTERGFSVEFPVPGFGPDQLEITHKDTLLTIVGKSDRRSFSQTLSLPEDIDADQIEAKVENGLLTLNLNRRPEAEPKRIAISHN